MSEENFKLLYEKERSERLKAGILIYTFGTLGSIAAMAYLQGVLYTVAFFVLASANVIFLINNAVDLAKCRGTIHRLERDALFKSNEEESAGLCVCGHGYLSEEGPRTLYRARISDHGVREFMFPTKKCKTCGALCADARFDVIAEEAKKRNYA